VLIGGKAAPGYAMAKSIIKLACSVAQVVNDDPACHGLLKVAYLPDYRVTVMEVISPGTDLSEQISTAGKEASGTGNMKFMINGALTIGTLDGANIEIREEAGVDNFFLFGLTAAEVEARRRDYNPLALVEADRDLQRVLKLLSDNHFNAAEPGIFDGIIRSLTEHGDYWMILADFRSYVEAQKRAAKAYRDQERWTRMSIINSATSGKFSSDRTIHEYNWDIWHLTPIAAQPVGGK
ncbi:MAG: glycogen/starch/alpha-glucan phosphorylase, partial [Sulfurimicrobium sp.]|nr:glycogen/starch/alpha-glucan phosphorylase [Sulfurimicrobium sp.]